jgi:hypothetical protein
MIRLIDSAFSLAVRGSNGRPLYAAAFIGSNQFMASTHIY